MPYLSASFKLKEKEENERKKTRTRKTKTMSSRWDEREHMRRKIDTHCGGRGSDEGQVRITLYTNVQTCKSHRATLLSQQSQDDASPVWCRRRGALVAATNINNAYLIPDSFRSFLSSFFSLFASCCFSHWLTDYFRETPVTWARPDVASRQNADEGTSRAPARPMRLFWQSARHLSNVFFTNTRTRLRRHFTLLTTTSSKFEWWPCPPNWNDALTAPVSIYVSPLENLMKLNLKSRGTTGNISGFGNIVETIANSNNVAITFPSGPLKSHSCPLASFVSGPV